MRGTVFLEGSADASCTRSVVMQATEVNAVLPACAFSEQNRTLNSKSLNPKHSRNNKTSTSQMNINSNHGNNHESNDGNHSNTNKNRNLCNSNDKSIVIIVRLHAPTRV